jgi:hypothetical protein
MLQWARPIWVGVQFPQRALSPKVGNKNSMIHKIIETLSFRVQQSSDAVLSLSPSGFASAHDDIF